MRDHTIEPTAPVTEPTGPAGPPPADQPTGWRGALSRHLAFSLVVAVVVIGLVRLLLYHWREGSVLIAGALLLAALFRALLPERTAGLLVVRGRPVDVLSYTSLGGLMMFVALTLTGGPFG